MQGDGSTASFLVNLTSNATSWITVTPSVSTTAFVVDELSDTFPTDGRFVVGPGVRFNSAGYLNNLAVAVPMGVSLYALSLLTFVGNAMVLHAIRTERRLQTVSNMFIMSLAVADLTVGMIVMPVSSAYAITGDWRLGLVLCQFWLAADYTASTASILNLLILSLDRYWSIRHPLKYIRKRTKRRAIVMIAIVWLVSSMWIVPIIGWHYWNSGGIRKQPSNVCETEFSDNVLFKLTASTINFYVPMVLMMALYAKIFYEIKKRSRFEIGQCNQGLSGSAYDVSVRGDGKAIGLSRNSSKSSLASNRIEEKPLKSGGGRQYIYADYRSHNHVHHHTQSEREQAERRFNRLTLMTLKPGSGPSQSTQPDQEEEPEVDGPDTAGQFFPGVTVNIEYVEEEGSEPNSDELAAAAGNNVGNQVKNRGAKRSKARRRSSSKSGSALTWLCPCLVSGGPGGQRSPGDSPTDGPGPAKGPRNVRMADMDANGAGQCRRTGSATSRRLNNNLNALRMRVTRKNFTSNLRQEKKAARQLGVIMGAFILCWLPYIIIFIVTAYCERCVSSPVHTASIWLGYLNSAMNPFLYALCNRNFKRAFRNMFRRRGGSKSRHFLPPASNAARTEQLFA